MNMCSVRQRPMPSAPSSRALAASSGVSAFARTLSRRASSAQSRIVSKSSLIRGGTSGTSPMITRPVPPSIVSTSPSCSSWPAIVAVLRSQVDRQRLAAGDARLAHPARDDRRVGRHAPVRGEHALGLDQPVDVVGSRLPAHEDDRLAGPAALLGGVRVEDDLAGRRARRGVQARRDASTVARRVDHRMEQLVELRRVDPGDRLFPRDQPFARPCPRRTSAPRRPSACRCASAAGRAGRPRS